MNYLQDRSAYSTITVTFEPKLPDLPTPTLTPTSTPTPTVTPEAWKPGETFNNAAGAVTSAYQGIINILIWFFVMVVPIVAPPVIIFWLLVKWLRKAMK
jgi:hypothetical protein